MHATDQLKEEHEGIKLMLNIMDKISGSAGEIDKVHLEKIIDFIRVFADKCHHGKEEGILFPELEKAGMSSKNGPIGVMLYEHTEGREFIKALRDAFEKYKAGDNSSIPAIRENLINYVNLLRSHIEKENNVLFMMADRALTDEKQEEIAEAFEKLEIEKIGAGKHEEYHQLLKELKKIYL